MSENNEVVPSTQEAAPTTTPEAVPEVQEAASAAPTASEQRPVSISDTTELTVKLTIADINKILQTLDQSELSHREVKRLSESVITQAKAQIEAMTPEAASAAA